MSGQYVYPKKAELQAWVLKSAADAEKSASGSDNAGRDLGRAQTSIQDSVVRKWWELADLLVTRWACLIRGFKWFIPLKCQKTRYH